MKKDISSLAIVLTLILAATVILWLKHGVSADGTAASSGEPTVYVAEEGTVAGTINAIPGIDLEAVEVRIGTARRTVFVEPSYADRLRVGQSVRLLAVYASDATGQPAYVYFAQPIGPPPGGPRVVSPR